jgi:hypothetical protein
MGKFGGQECWNKHVRGGNQGWFSKCSGTRSQSTAEQSGAGQNSRGARSLSAQRAPDVTALDLSLVAAHGKALYTFLLAGVTNQHG